MTADENKQIAALLRKNYGLESLPDIDLNDRAGDVGAILQLNAAGRRYLVQDGSSISKGVDLLSHVNANIDCVFLHLLESPRLVARQVEIQLISLAEESESKLLETTARNPAGD